MIKARDVEVRLHTVFCIFSNIYLLNGVDGMKVGEVVRTEMLHDCVPCGFVESRARKKFRLIYHGDSLYESSIFANSFQFAWGGVSVKGLLEKFSSSVDHAMS